MPTSDSIETNPWSVLGLDGAAADAKAVRAAAARLVKKHQKKKDLIGMRKVELAREVALVLLKEAKSSGLTEAKGEETAGTAAEAEQETLPLAVEEKRTTPEPPPASASGKAKVPAPKPAVEDELELSEEVYVQPAGPVAVGGAADQEKPFLAAVAARDALLLAEAVDDLRLFYFAKPADPVRWGATMERLFAGLAGEKKQWAAGAVHPRTLMEELAAGTTTLSTLVLDVAAERADPKSALALGRIIALEPERVKVERVMPVLKTLVEQTAFYERKTADALLKQLEPHLDAEQTRSLVPKLKQEMALGHPFLRLPVDQRAFWRERCLEPDRGWDWECKEAGEARERLRRTFEATWPGWVAVKAVVPEGWLENLGKFRRAEAGTFGQRPQKEGFTPSGRSLASRLDAAQAQEKLDELEGLQEAVPAAARAAGRERTATEPLARAAATPAAAPVTRPPGDRQRVRRVRMHGAPDAGRTGVRIFLIMLSSIAVLGGLVWLVIWLVERGK